MGARVVLDQIPLPAGMQLLMRVCKYVCMHACLCVCICLFVRSFVLCMFACLLACVLCASVCVRVSFFCFGCLWGSACLGLNSQDSFVQKSEMLTGIPVDALRCCSICYDENRCNMHEKLKAACSNRTPSPTMKVKLRRIGTGLLLLSLMNLSFS